MASDIPKYYWDACIWITLISDRKSERGKACEYVLNLAKGGKCQIWTSSFCLAEVFKRRCDSIPVGIAEKDDAYFEDLIEQVFVYKVSVDVDVGKVARKLLRRFPTIGKPQDAIHVATCLLNNLDELHTYDRDDLLTLDGQLVCSDRTKLRICQPPEPPRSVEPELQYDVEDKIKRLNFKARLTPSMPTKASNTLRTPRQAGGNLGLRPVPTI